MGPPIDFSQPPDPQAAGIDPQAADQLAALFEQQITDGLHPAAQMVVLKDGHVIFDRASGSFDGKPVTAQTPFYCFSVTKAFTGICVHKLIEDGQLSLDTRVSDVWPAFGKKGKQEITIRQVFLHLAGIPAINRYDHIPFWPSWKLISSRVASLAPEYAPGSKMAYHALTYGFILGEVVRRVSGVPLNEYFSQHFSRPMGLKNSWLKIPPTQLERSPALVSACKDQNNLVRIFNLRTVRKALIPAASLHSTARDLAVFYHMLVNQGKYAGRQYLKPETIRQAASLGFSGIDELSQRFTYLGYGFHLGGRPTSQNEGESSFGARSTLHTFGHMGNRSSMAWGDFNHRLAVAFTCNRLLENEANRQRWIRLNNAVWDILGV